MGNRQRLTRTLPLPLYRFRGQLADLSSMVPGKQPHVPEATGIGDIGDGYAETSREMYDQRSRGTDRPEGRVFWGRNRVEEDVFYGSGNDVAGIGVGS